MTALLAIDPGTTHSGWVCLRDGSPWNCGVSENREILDMLVECRLPVAMEMIASYGMAVGAEVFATCRWIGRFQQAYRDPEAVRLIYRKDVKLHLCGSPRAKDANVRQALIDRFGGKAVAIGNKKQPGPLYAVKSHAWSALAVAITAMET